jgi:hypothetical protein
MLLCILVPVAIDDARQPDGDSYDRQPDGKGQPANNRSTRGKPYWDCGGEKAGDARRLGPGHSTARWDGHEQPACLDAGELKALQEADCLVVNNIVARAKFLDLRRQRWERVRKLQCLKGCHARRLARTHGREGSAAVSRATAWQWIACAFDREKWVEVFQLRAGRVPLACLCECLSAWRCGRALVFDRGRHGRVVAGDSAPQLLKDQLAVHKPVCAVGAADEPGQRRRHVRVVPEDRTNRARNLLALAAHLGVVSETGLTRFNRRTPSSARSSTRPADTCARRRDTRAAAPLRGCARCRCSCASARTACARRRPPRRPARQTCRPR